MLDDVVVPDCNFRIKSEVEDKCLCSHGKYSYKGLFNKDFCKTCPIANKTSGPTLAEKIINLTVAGLKHVANGLKNVSDEEKAKIMEICSGCEVLNKNDNSCGNCGCFVSVKAAWESEKCPLGKW